MYDSGGVILNVPLPISLLIVSVALLQYAKESIFIHWKEAVAVLGIIAATTAIAGFEFRKLTLLAQFLIPAAALVLGRRFHDQRSLAVTWLVILVAFIPVQLAIPVAMYNVLVLHHDMLFFSIYQHRQFVPVLFVAAYLIALFSLYDDRRWRIPLIAATIVVGFYAVIAVSILALALLFAGLVSLVFLRASRFSCALSAAAIAACIAGAYLIGGEFSAKQKYAVIFSEKAAQEVGAGRSFQLLPWLPVLRVPINIEHRIRDWKLYGDGILESPQAALLGHPKPIERAVATSAHNYYLDLIYNFGLLAFLPLAMLIAITLRALWIVRRTLREDLALAGLALVVLFIVVVDSNFKVTLRQPYPGVLTFFLWGMLLSKLAAAKFRESPVKHNFLGATAQINR